MKLNLNSIFKPFFSLRNTTSFKFIYQQIFARNLYIKITFGGMILVLLIIWVLWIKIVVGFYPLVMPFFITQSIPALIRPYLLPSITTLFVFINFGITSLVYKKIPKIIYLLLPITIYLETIILATAIYYLIKF